MMTAQGSSAITRRDAIPFDIYSPILNYLLPPELAICSRVSKSFHLITIPLLYISIDVNLGKGLHALSGNETKVLGEPSRMDKILKRMRLGLIMKSRRKEDEKSINDIEDKADKEIEKKAVLKEEKEIEEIFKSQLFRSSQAAQRSRLATFTPPDPLLFTLPNRFSFTTHLTLSSHSHTTCDHLTPVPMPNLGALQINCNPNQRHLNLCECRHSTKNKRGPQCTAAFPCVCPIIARLQPRKLIIKGDMLGTTGAGMGLWRNDPGHPPPWLKEIEVYLGVCCIFGDGNDIKRKWLWCIPPTIEKLTIYLQPKKEIYWKDGDYVIKPKHLGSTRRSKAETMMDELGIRFQNDYTLLSEDLAMALSGEAKIMEVVGLDSVYEGCNGAESGWAKKEQVKKYYTEELMRRGWKEWSAEQRVQAIHFVER